MSEEVLILKKYPREYYASEQDMRNKRWRRFSPWPVKRIHGYEFKSGIRAVRQF